jgi:hypothetical protein
VAARARMALTLFEPDVSGRCRVNDALPQAGPVWTKTFAAKRGRPHSYTQAGAPSTLPYASAATILLHPLH